MKTNGATVIKSPVKNSKRVFNDYFTNKWKSRFNAQNKILVERRRTKKALLKICPDDAREKYFNIIKTLSCHLGILGVKRILYLKKHFRSH